MAALAGGDKSIRVPHANRADEVGAMAGAVEVFRANMIRADELAAEQEKERAAREKRAQTIETLTQEFDDKISAVVGHLGAATTQMQSTASSMAAIAEETNRQSPAVANRPEDSRVGKKCVGTGKT